MLSKALALRLFEASYIQRWNDKIRPVELTELDKHSHKMIIAYCLGKYEEGEGRQVDWHGIIKGGVFELFRRIVLSDIKSPVYNKIKDKYPHQFAELNRWVFGKIGPEIDSVAGGTLRDEFKNYLEDEKTLDPLTRKILAAAHHYATYWEFQIIRQTNPLGYQIPKIEQALRRDLEQHMDLVGMRKIVTAGKVADFIDLCGQLRFQVRWGGIPRLPRTSVLGHMLMTACLTYLLTREIPACDRRLFNNFFGALFHDLPEAVTRDIISPVKNSVEGMPEAISQIERELAEEEIYPLLEEGWLGDFKYFTLNEFASKVRKDGKIEVVSSDDISKQYNDDRFNPVDGELVEVADKFSAFLEAYMSKKIGVSTPHMEGALKVAESLKSDDRMVTGILVKELYRMY
jgi:putative hydrolase of HD superfamily